MRISHWLMLSTALGCAPAPKAKIAKTRSARVVAVPVLAPTAGVRVPDPLLQDLTVATAPFPDGLVVDGDVGQWPVPQASTPMIYLAFASDRLAIAAVMPSEGPPVALALATSIPRVPDIGWITRGFETYALDERTCAREQSPGVEGSWDEGKPHPPEVVKACLALVERHREFSATYYERFVRRFRLSSAGLTWSDGTVIEGAEVVAKGGVVEASLPLGAMPWLAQAPLAEILVATAEESLPEDLPLPVRHWRDGPDPRWKALALATPVRFEPYPAVRHEIFKEFLGLGSGWEHSISYHPASPEVIESVSTPESSTSIAFGSTTPTRLAAATTQEKLFHLIEQLGEVKIGLSNGSMVVVLKRGVITGLGYVGDLRGVAHRDDQLHLFSYSIGGLNPIAGQQYPPVWRVIAVRGDGTLVEAIADEGVDFPGPWIFWDKAPQPFHDSDFTRFGMRGTRNGRPKTVTWKWNAGEHRYRSAVQPPNQAGRPAP